jgi:NAD(P)H-dependent flavin oxidoreductase YrpB (nitropropane dioxygenase family)
LDTANPVLAAPMAGGGSTPDLVAAADAAGSLGFLAAGYKSPQALAEQLDAVRARSERFGVNLFAPNPLPVGRAAYRAYADAIEPVARDYDVTLPTEPIEDDDGWAAKVDHLLANPVTVASFTFGIPSATVIDAFRRVGTFTVQTVTSVAEARSAVASGVDGIAVQSAAAGGHSATLDPARPPEQLVPLAELVASVRTITDLLIIAAGGIATATDVTACLGAGANAVMVGTALLRSDESGASAVHKAAIADIHRGDPVLTRAFTGRPARALRNRFIDQFDGIAPLGYPAIHHLTSGLRKASAEAGDPEQVHLWAGTGYRSAAAEPADTILERLAGSV